MNQVTTDQRRLSIKYLSYRMLTNLWFIGTIWLYFYRLFITDQQVGILDGVAFAIGLLAEVPSGALADRFGRDKMVKLGQILAGGGLLIQAGGSSFMPLFVGQAIMMIGISFVSGADEALFFEKLNFDRSSPHWRKLLMRGSQVALVGALLAYIAGGWLHTINPRIPWILNGLAFISSAFLLWSIKDTRPGKRNVKILGELREHLTRITSGFSQFRIPKLWLYVPIIITVQGLFYTFDYGLLRVVLLDRFHFDPFFGSLVVAASGLITIGILALLHKYPEDISEERVLVFFSLSAAVSLLVSIADIGMWGCVIILVLYAGEHVLHPFMSEVLNNRAPEDQRATVLSVASFLRTLPYVALAPIIGYMNTHDKLAYFLVVWAILVFLAVLFYLSLKKKDAYVSMVTRENAWNHSIHGQA